MADQARTIEDLNGLMRRMMKTALERMLNTEMDVHLGRKASAPSEGDAESSAEPPLASESATPPAESARRSPTAATAVRGRRCGPNWAI